jgi:hypothetical protein
LRACVESSEGSRKCGVYLREGAILRKITLNRRGRTLWILIGSICKSNLGGRIKSTENCFLDGRLFPCLKPLIRCPDYATKLSQNLDLRERGLLDKKDRIEIGLNPRVRIAERRTLCRGFCWPGAMRLKKIGAYFGIGESGVGQASRRVEKRMKRDRRVNQKLEALEKRIIK